MKEIISEKLRHKSIYIHDIAVRIEEICTENKTRLKSVNANLADCSLQVETEHEKFNMNYNLFNPVNQCFVFN